MTEPDKPENTPSSVPPPPPPPPNPGQQQAYPPQQQQPYQQQPYGYGSAQGGYPPPPQGGYGAGMPGGYGAGPVQQAPKNGVGIAALIVAIIALLSVYGGVVLGVVAVILGVIGRGRAKRGEATNGGFALAGIVLGLLSIIVGIVAIVLTVQFVQEVGGTDLYDCLQQAGSDAEAQQDCQDQFQQNIEEQFNISITPSP